MSIYSRKYQVSLPIIILGCTLTLLLVFIYMTIAMTDKSLTAKEGPLWIFAAGLVPGLAVALVQFSLSWAEFRQVSKFNAMKIEGVLHSRDEEEYYRNVISKAETYIQVLGVTASRFATDFSDESATRIDKKILIAALERGVCVRILVPESRYLSENERTQKFPVAERIFSSLSQRYINLEVRYFDHQPFASLVRVDDDALFGPVFQNQESRHTPTIHTKTGSALAQSYMNHFEKEWAEARPLQIAE